MSPATPPGYEQAEPIAMTLPTPARAAASSRFTPMMTFRWKICAGSAMQIPSPP